MLAAVVGENGSSEKLHLLRVDRMNQYHSVVASLNTGHLDATIHSRFSLVNCLISRANGEARSDAP